MLKAFSNVDTGKIFSIGNTSRIRTTGVKLICRQVQLDCTNFFFTNDMVRGWNELPPSVMQCSTIKNI